MHYRLFIISLSTFSTLYWLFTVVCLCFFFFFYFDFGFLFYFPLFTAVNLELLPVTSHIFAFSNNNKDILSLNPDVIFIKYCMYSLHKSTHRNNAIIQSQARPKRWWATHTYSSFAVGHLSSNFPFKAWLPSKELNEWLSVSCLTVHIRAHPHEESTELKFPVMVPLLYSVLVKCAVVLQLLLHLLDYIWSISFFSPAHSGLRIFFVLRVT